MDLRVLKRFRPSAQIIDRKRVHADQSDEYTTGFDKNVIVNEKQKITFNLWSLRQ